MVSIIAPKRESTFSSNEKTPSSKDGYLPSIDGLRAISIVMVTGAHLGMAYKSYDHYLHPIANLGVQFFFVISGFLITTLLLKEKEKSGEISLKKFYIRRFFRIIPVAYLYLLIVLAINLVSDLNMNYYSILLSFLFVRNFSINAKGFNNLSSHYWSLSVEEQFYLLFPVILKKSLFYFIMFLIVMMFSPIIINIVNILYSLPDLKIPAVNYLSQLFSQFQAISIGSFCAIFLYKEDKRALLNTSQNTAITLLFLVTIACLIFFRSTIFSISNMAISFLFAGVIIVNIQKSETYSFKVLNNKYLKYVGTLSYSIYIWQQPFAYSLTFIKKLSIFQPYSTNVLFNALVTIGSIGAISVVSYFSYFFYEKRFLLLKSRFN